MPARRTCFHHFLVLAFHHHDRLQNQSRAEEGWAEKGCSLIAEVRARHPAAGAPRPLLRALPCPENPASRLSGRRARQPASSSLTDNFSEAPLPSQGGEQEPAILRYEFVSSLFLQKSPNGARGREGPGAQHPLPENLGDARSAHTEAARTRPKAGPRGKSPRGSWQTLLPAVPDSPGDGARQLSREMPRENLATAPRSSARPAAALGRWS